MGKKSNKTTSKTIYGETTTTNPFVTSQTNNKGTTTVFNPNSAFSSINNFVNNNMSTLLDNYLNPSLDSVTNQAKMDSFINSLNTQSQKSLENNIINPLSNRNMLRSSQATDLYNKLASSNANQIGNYANELLANSQSETANVLSNLMLMYMNAFSAMSDTQKQSLSASQGNSTKSNNLTNSDTSLDMSSIMQLALQLAM